MVRWVSVISVLMLCASLACHAQGLMFRSSDNTVEERTSLTIVPQAPYSNFRKEFNMSFEISVRDFDSFGYIFLIADPSSGTKYSLTYTYLDSENSAFKFNTDGVENHLSFEMPNDSLAYRWIPVSLSFDIRNSTLEVSVCGQSGHVENIRLSSPFRPELHFGRYDYILDIPSFAIRNLTLTGGKKSLGISFHERSGCAVHSDDGEIAGTVENPIWLINNSYYWTKLFEVHSDSPSGISFDSKRQKLIAFNQDSVWHYDLHERSLLAEKPRTPLEVQLQLAMSFMDTDDGNLYVYELNNLPEGDVTVASLNPLTMEWNSQGTAFLPVQLHHHCSWFDGNMGKYVVFGGFGNKRFNNSFYRYDIAADSWDTLEYTGDAPMPRYFSGLAVNGTQDRVYIYGGMGNDTGDQSIGRKYLHDLHMLDLSSGEMKCLWSHDSAEQFVTARNMVLSPDGKYLTALFYKEYVTDSNLQLVKFSVEDGTAEVLAETVPIRSGEIATNANLYYNGYMSEYYCTTVEFSKDGHTVTRAFALAAPAVGKEMMMSYDDKEESGMDFWKWLVLALTAIFSSLALVAATLSVRRKALSTQRQDNAPSTEAKPACHTAKSAPVASGAVSPAVNAIFLFGQFSVIDRKGHDITYMFSTRLKQVFVYMLVPSYDGTGVLSSALNDIFWPDKTPEKVKNLKGVTINQIRKCLAELDGISLEYEKGYFRAVISEGCYCDYFRYRNLKKVPEAYRELGTLLMRGKFLESFESGLLDRTKQIEEEFLVAFLPTEIERLFRERKYSAVARYCRLLLEVEPVNEFALAYAVRSLEHSVSSQEALIQYSLFVREYRQLMGEDYPVSFTALLEGELPKCRG